MLVKQSSFMIYFFKLTCTWFGPCIGFLPRMRGGVKKGILLQNIYYLLKTTHLDDFWRVCWPVSEPTPFSLTVFYMHTSQFQTLGSTKSSSKMFHILYTYKKTQSCFFRFSFRATLCFYLMNALVYVDIEQGIHKVKR